MSESVLQNAIEKSIDTRAAMLLREHQLALWKQTDRLFAMLITLQWIAGIAVAIWLSPLAWEGLQSHVHPHVWTAIFLGGLIASLPIKLAVTRPGETSTRMVIAVGQMMQSALLIHLSGGRIETHFHIFGSLAFLSFYRDWRVLVPATIVVALDHALRGMFWPQSIFGIASAEPWRWMEHAGWVIFEDIFLVWSCVRGAKELALLAHRQAELEATNDRVEAEVARKTFRLAAMSEELIATARRAGMAEIATGVLHNVGNVLNSVNVSASVVTKLLRNSEIASVVKVSELLRAHESDMAAFLTSDSQGRHLPPFLIELADCLSKEQVEMLRELQAVERGLDHIKQIVGAQQKHAKCDAVNETIVPAELFDHAIIMAFGASTTANLNIVRRFQPIPGTVLDKHRVLQILVNLLTNARHAIKSSGRAEGCITVGTRVMESAEGERLQFEVTDNGIGIAEADLARIFGHGFTTNKEGHGFGLHSAANAARGMKGNLWVVSKGSGCGATFTLDMPMNGLNASATQVAA